MENKQRNIYAHITRIRHHKKNSRKEKGNKNDFARDFFFSSPSFFIHSLNEWFIQ